MTDDAGAPDEGHDPGRDADAESDDGEWRFGLDDVGPEAEERRAPEPIEPESVDAENALFVVAGALGTILFVFSATL